ncbi:uncharacterized protein DSM5745_02435 [Aspergillus mulundensis]|uniref:Uncharacterized protein n=1 Tax=Aspergillus mulundensis TaxID=1810919 RepID=A0A3D8SWJ6_9EURO|nr:hypothetical protein DSM5745_02435 [Aspergillus mulundensis]RDW90660.1 hypothetical protein DSM5745_02435 [Aspergillus mulundensis]
MDDKENPRLLKIRHGDEKACVNLTEWLDRVKRSPKFVFSQLYEQQESYVDVIRSLQSKLSEYKSRISYLEHNPNKTHISQLENKLAKREERLQMFRMRNTEMNNRLASQNQEQEAYKDQITALKAKLSVLEERTREYSTRIARLNAELAAHEQEHKLDQQLIMEWESRAEKYESIIAELEVQKETVRKQSTRIVELLNALATATQQQDKQVADLNDQLKIERQQHNAYTGRFVALSAQLEGEKMEHETSRGQIAELSDRLDAQTQQQEAYKDRIAELENKLTAQTTLHDGNTSEGTYFSFTETTQTKALPDPPLLNDKDYPSVANWKYLMEMKFRENADHFDSPAARLAYLISRTTSEVQDQLVDRLRSKVLEPITDVRDALEFLEMVYHRPELGTTDVEDFRMPDENLGSFWEYFKAFIWNAVRNELPETEWPRKLHEFLRLRVINNVDFFFTYPESSPKDLAKEVYLRLLRQGQHDEIVLGDGLEQHFDTGIQDSSTQDADISIDDSLRGNYSEDEGGCLDRPRPDSVVESACSIVDIVQARGVKWS